MLRWLGRLVLFRILPRKIVPLLALVEVVQLLRAVRNQRRPDDGQRRPDDGQRRPDDGQRRPDARERGATVER